jgi:hypothetical protein
MSLQGVQKRLFGEVMENYDAEDRPWRLYVVFRTHPMRLFVPSDANLYG